jgi:hypothetical protein
MIDSPAAHHDCANTINTALSACMTHLSCQVSTGLGHTALTPALLLPLLTSLLHRW